MDRAQCSEGTSMKDQVAEEECMAGLVALVVRCFEVTSTKDREVVVGCTMDPVVPHQSFVVTLIRDPVAEVECL